jgi:hypothetical protein
MPCPLLYEVNTRCWLRELSDRVGAPVTLGQIPDPELAALRERGVTHLWLMGVWTTGPRSRARALAAELWPSYRAALPDCAEADVAASPYAVARYQVAENLGGNEALRAFRSRLREMGIKLVLDFVPNHVGLDHPWVSARPELFVHGPPRASGTFVQKTSRGSAWLAHGRDPYFPPWTDTVQLDYRRGSAREAMIRQLAAVAELCDGARCDMAMLVLRDVFERTWTAFPPAPADASGDAAASAASEARAGSEEFWSLAIATVRNTNPDFLFLAEAYWGLEGRLRSLGFDYTYDKELYDALVRRDAGQVSGHLLRAQPGDVEGGAHFLENHDEPRIATLLSSEEHRAAALLTLALPGLRFLHQGQLEGAGIRTPIQLLRRRVEQPRQEIKAMYDRLLTALSRAAVGRGRGVILTPRPAWAGNPTAQNMVLVQWQASPPDFSLAVVNLAPHRSQCYAPLNPEGLADQNWRLTDLLGCEEYRRSGTELARGGLYLDVPGHAAQLFDFKPIAAP